MATLRIAATDVVAANIADLIECPLWDERVGGSLFVAEPAVTGRRSHRFT